MNLHEIEVVRAQTLKRLLHLLNSSLTTSVPNLVARKSCWRKLIPAARSPTTLSELPYMGDESTTLPPSFTSSLNTWRSCPRSDSDPPTSHVCQVPSPTAGNVSRELGMGRRTGVADAAIALGSDAKSRPAPAQRRSSSRRESCRGTTDVILELKGCIA